MFIDNLLDSDSQVNKAALRSTANSALMRACGIAMRLAGFAAKHIGNGVDGHNDLIAARDAALAKAQALNSAGRDSESLETVMHRLMTLYLSIQGRMAEESWFKPMSLDEALGLMATEREYDKTEGAEYIAALAKVTGESEESLRARQSRQAGKQAERNRDLAPIARTFLEECSDSGETEDQIFADLPVNVQFSLFAKATDSAANQLDRDIDRSMQFMNSKSSVLRNLAISDTAAGKADLNQLEATLTRFVQLNRHALDL